MTFFFFFCFYEITSVWLDLRTQATVEGLINKTPGRNKNHWKVIYIRFSLLFFTGNVAFFYFVKGHFCTLMRLYNRAFFILMPLLLNLVEFQFIPQCHLSFLHV